MTQFLVQNAVTSYFSHTLANRIVMIQNNLDNTDFLIILSILFVF